MAARSEAPRRRTAAGLTRRRCAVRFFAVAPASLRCRAGRAGLFEPRDRPVQTDRHCCKLPRGCGNVGVPEQVSHLVHPDRLPVVGFRTLAEGRETAGRRSPHAGRSQPSPRGCQTDPLLHQIAPGEGSTGTVLGPGLLVASMVPRARGFKHGNCWQYHSRSDHHSKVACWSLLFDLLRHCALLRQHATDGLVGYGLNHEMRDFRTGRKKNLDLVVCRPRSVAWHAAPAPTFADQAQEIDIVLDTHARGELARLPTIHEMAVGAVHIALEAKACMTEFIKAKPRLYGSNWTQATSPSTATLHTRSPQAWPW